MHTGNPALNEKIFQTARREGTADAGVMTVQGTIAKASILLLAVLVASIFTWQKTMAGAAPQPWIFGGMIVGLILGLVVSFKPKLAPTLAVPYALAEGLFLGGLSAMYAVSFSGKNALGGMSSGIVLQAVVLTFSIAFVMLALYALRIIRVTERLRSIVMVATGGVMLMYLISFALSFFMSSSPIGFLHSAGPVGIGFSLFVIGLAAFNLLVDFDMIEQGARQGAPKFMEWYGGFALLVTLVWLYIEVLRLLSKLQSRD